MAMRWTIAVLAMLLGAFGCAGAAAPSADSPGSAKTTSPQVQRGKATWYGGKFHGRKTASGERFDKQKLTAAHRSLPFGTVVKVVNELNGAEVTVRINDRGPFGKGRIIDVSEAAARELDMLDRGVVPVTVQVVRLP